MERISSFSIDHMRLMPGVYVSRVDKFGDAVITTFDIRVTRPNFEEVLTTGVIHAIEHLLATYFRNDEKFKERVVYFGPMGCRTGFYLLLHGGKSPYVEEVDLIRRGFIFAADFEGEIPGASEIECGNCKDMDLLQAKFVARDFIPKIGKEIALYP